MSYSFNVRGVSKDAAKALVAAEFGKVVEGQPSHVADRDAAVAAASAFIDVLQDPPDGKCVNVSMWGSLSWIADGVFVQAQVSIQASVVDVA